MPSIIADLLPEPSLGASREAELVWDRVVQELGTGPVIMDEDDPDLDEVWSPINELSLVIISCKIIF